MAMVTGFYLSRILGNKVLSGEGKVIGRLQDLIISVTDIRPRVIAAKIRSKNKSELLDFSFFSVGKDRGQYMLVCQKKVSLSNPLQENTMSLVKTILDKQIVDINGKKVVRVNDVRLAFLSGNLFCIAVDVGLEGLLRRIGLAKPVKSFLKLLGMSLPSKLILWDEVGPITSCHSNIKLSTTYSKLLTLHHSDLADIIEDLDKKTQATFFDSLDEEKAADVLEEMETEAQINVLRRISVQKAADVLEKMPADEVADILDDLREEKAEELLREMDKAASAEVRELMDYPATTVGSIMSTDFIAFKTNFTVEQTICELRRLKPEPDTAYYLYIIDEKGTLKGVVSLRDLIISDPDTYLSEIMTKDIIYIKDMDNFHTLIETVSKYNLLAIPVVDSSRVLVGTVIINDIVYELLKNRRKRT